MEPTSLSYPWSSEAFFPGKANSEIFQGGSNMVKFHFTYSKLRKQPFLLNCNKKMSNFKVRWVRSLLPLPTPMFIPKSYRAAPLRWGKRCTFSQYSTTSQSILSRNFESRPRNFWTSSQEYFLGLDPKQPSSSLLMKLSTWKITSIVVRLFTFGRIAVLAVVGRGSCLLSKGLSRLPASTTAFLSRNAFVDSMNAYLYLSLRFVASRLYTVGLNDIMPPTNRAPAHINDLCYTMNRQGFCGREGLVTLQLYYTQQ